MTEEKKKVKTATFNVTFTFETFINFYLFFIFYLAVTAKCPDKLKMSRYKQFYDVYFDRRLGAAHFKHCSKSPFLCFCMFCKILM